MFPTLQGEKFISPVSATGLMMYLALASHELAENGQHTFELVMHPFVSSHEQPSAQSC